MLHHRLRLVVPIIISVLAATACDDDSGTATADDACETCSADSEDARDDLGDADEGDVADTSIASDAGADGESDTIGSDGSDARDATETLDAPDVDATADADTGDATTILPADASALYAWRGFHHEWLRTVVGFRVPHRISKLDSYLSDAAIDTDRRGSSAQFHFGQATGVDGNYMKPLGFYDAAHASGIVVHDGETQTRWTDDTNEDDPYPQARTDLDLSIVVDVSDPSIDGPYDQHVALLRGFSLTSRCDDAKQPADNPCNSDGFWPFKIAISIDACTLTGTTLDCPLDVAIYRAWTPNRGGLPGIEEKPLNDKLDYDLYVYWTIVAGDVSELNVVRSGAVTGSGPARQNEPVESTRQLESAAGYPHAVVGMTGFGFEFVKTGTADSRNHLGRYIGALNFETALEAYDPTMSNSAQARFTTQVWIPDTVVETDVEYEMESVLLQVSDPGETFVAQTAEGSLCSNSSDQAPFFSAWKKCDEPDKGPEQTEDVVELAQ